MLSLVVLELKQPNARMVDALRALKKKRDCLWSRSRTPAEDAEHLSVHGSTYERAICCCVPRDTGVIDRVTHFTFKREVAICFTDIKQPFNKVC